MAATMIRVFCVDDHEATTELYHRALELEPDMEFAGSSTSTAGLLEALERANPSVLLLDLLIPGCDTLQALRDVRARFPSLTILVASGLEEDSAVDEVFRLGASGFFLKGMDLAGLTSIIRGAATGERVNTGLRPGRSFGTRTIGGTRPEM